MTGAVALIVNPRAGHGAGARLGQAVAAELGRLGLPCVAQFTAMPGDAGALTGAALATGTATVVVAGGDGTFNEAANGFVGAAGAGQALGLVPLGTGNDFCKALGIPADWRAACARIAAGRLKSVDAGRCNGRVFVNGVGAGFDARVALEASRVRWVRGAPVYLVALAKALLLRHATPGARITHDGGTLEGPVTLVVTMNGTHFGGVFPIAPDASIDDGLLELLVAPALTRRGILRLLPYLLRGTHTTRPGITHLRTGRVRVEFDQPVVLQADGEILDTEAVRVDVTVEPGALRLLC